jgi:hypothetical protein
MQLRTSVNNGDRVSHSIKGLRTVCVAPAKNDVLVPDAEEQHSGGDMIYVVWDDDRFPVEKLPLTEVEVLLGAYAAISTGI